MLMNRFQKILEEVLAILEQNGKLMIGMEAYENCSGRGSVDAHVVACHTMPLRFACFVFFTSSVTVARLPGAAENVRHSADITV